MTVALSPVPFQFLPNPNNTGSPALLFRLFTYIAGTSTKQNTWTDSTQTVVNANPLTLDANGFIAASSGAGLWLDPTLSYKLVWALPGVDDPPTSPVRTMDNVRGPIDGSSFSSFFTTALTQVVIGTVLYPQTAAETSAGVTPTNYFYPPLDGRRYGMQFNNSGDDTIPLNNGLSVGSQTVNGALGAALSVPVTGISILTSEVTLPNRVRLLGYNKRGTYFQAKSSWNSGTSPWMFHAFNGTSSMFDSTLENLSVDCNNIAGLGGILSDAWQEDCGLRGVLLTNFGTAGIKYQNGYGGASLSKIVDTEIFGGSIASALGIDLSTPMGAAAAFMLDVSNTSISGLSAPTALTAGISCKGNSLLCRNVHFEYATSGALLDGSGFISLDDLTASSTVTSLVTVASTFTGVLVMKNCRRNGATNFVNDLRAGGYGAISYDEGFFILNANVATDVAKGAPIASCWAVFDGTGSTPITPSASYNVSGSSLITKNGAGDYTITLQRAMLSTNAAAFASCNLAASAGSAITCRVDLSTSSTFRVRIYQNGVLTDSNEVKVLIFGG